MDSAPSPLTPREVVDEYFIENRTRLLEIAAFLDRLDRTDPSYAAADFRMQAFNDALAAVSQGKDRLERIQLLLSDPTTEPLGALDRKSAFGAYDRGGETERRRRDVLQAQDKARKQVSAASEPPERSGASSPRERRCKRIRQTKVPRRKNGLHRSSRAHGVAHD